MLKRKYARICIVLAEIAIVGFGLGLTFSFFGYTYRLIVLGAALVFVIAELIVKYFYHRCPSCDKATPPLQWSESGNRYCDRCGARFDYDKVYIDNSSDNNATKDEDENQWTPW